jgi:hypothetical protein
MSAIRKSEGEEDACAATRGRVTGTRREQSGRRRRRKAQSKYRAILSVHSDSQVIKHEKARNSRAGGHFVNDLFPANDRLIGKGIAV